MIKGIIFDVDGTILASMETWHNAGARYLKTLGKEAEENLGDILFELSIEEGAEYLKKNYALDLNIEEISEGILDSMGDFYFNEAALKEGAEEMLEEIAKRGIPMTVATSSDKEHITAAFERLDIMHYFKEIFTCSQVGAGKSQPLIFEMAAECMGTNPDETYVFEDGLYAVRTANDAGFKTVGIYDSVSDSDWNDLKKEADIYLNDLKEFNKIWEVVL